MKLARNLRALFLAATATLLSPIPSVLAPASAQAQTHSATAPNIPFEKYKLANGMEVILAPQKGVPTTSVSVWYHVGSGYETVGKSGFAHLFEHMLFQGSANVGSDKHFETLKRVGVSNVNGTTNPDRTNYFEVVPSNQLETALWLESDRMGYLLSMLTETSLKNQIDVVRNERRQRYDNVPYGKTRFAIAAALYPEGHPYRYLTIGRHEDLESASLEDVKNFYRTWYVPSNATLTISGDFDVEATKAMVQKWFGSFPASTKPTPVVVPAPAAKAQDIVIEDAFAKLPRLEFVWLSPANFGAGDAELDIAATALGDQGSGRLYKKLVLEKQLAQSVAAYQYGAQFSGEFHVVVTARPGADLGEIKKIVADEVGNVTKTPISTREFKRAFAGFEAQTIYGLEAELGRGEALQSFNHYLGDPGKLAWNLDRYRNSSPEAVRAAAATYLTPARLVTVTTMPGGKK